MKLAEALQERADLNQRLEQLRSRLNENALVQEGEEPAEDPLELLQELDNVSSRLEQLISMINLANANTKKDSITITEMIAKKDVLKVRIAILRDFLYSASATASRARNSEIRILSTVNVREKRKELDALSKQLRMIDNQIQELNWTTEI